MSLKQTIQDDMKTALLSGNRFRGDVLRGLKAAILNEEVATGKREDGLDDASIEKVIAKEVKKRFEAAKLYRDNSRPELADPEEKEADILKEYLPEQLSDDDIRAKVKELIQTLAVSGPQAKGQVIGAAKHALGTAADGATIARIVNEELS